jgi:hypothetical protein
MQSIPLAQNGRSNSKDFLTWRGKGTESVDMTPEGEKAEKTGITVHA